MSRLEKRMYRRSLNPPRSAKNKVVRVRLTEAEYQHLKALARKKKLKLSTLMRYYIHEGIKRE